MKAAIAELDAEIARREEELDRLRTSRETLVEIGGGARKAKVRRVSKARRPPRPGTKPGAQSKQGTTRQKIADLMKAHPGATLQQIAKLAGRNPEAVRYHWKALGK